MPLDEKGQPDHLIFVVHGIGEFSDSLFRTLTECTDDMRKIALKMSSKHFKKSHVNRVEFLPIHWNSSLHGENTEIENILKQLTLKSINRLRDFTNGTLLDILLYASPVYCQRIVDTISKEIDRVYFMFLKRNPGFSGKISLAGHSLGSLILFDLLCNQVNHIEKKYQTNEKSVEGFLNNNQGQQQQQNNSQSLLTTNFGLGDHQNFNLFGPTSDKPITKSSDEILAILRYLDIYSQKLLQKFVNEEIYNLDSLKLLNEEHLQNISVPLGSRLKIMEFLKDEKKLKQFREIYKPHVEDKTKEKKNNVASPSQMVDDALSILNLGSTDKTFNYQTLEKGAGIGQPCVKYPQFPFKKVHAFFALGSPISMFLAVRGVSELGIKFQLPTCDNMYNIFHPFDPVAYRIEPLVNKSITCNAVMIPHHTGRKRFHLELKDNIAKMGADFKNTISQSMSSVYNSINSIISYTTSFTGGQQQKNSEDQPSQSDNQTFSALSQEVTSTYQDVVSNNSAESMKQLYEDKDPLYGNLNNMRRIDFVLQEKPLEAFNDYLFAFQSHLCYWESEDTILMILREVYGLEGVRTIDFTASS